MNEDKLDKPSKHISKFSSIWNKIRNVPLPLLRTVLKASIAISVTLILVLANKSRLLIGPAATLSAIATLIYLPVRPVGVQIKITMQGLLSAGIGSAWCYLGNYLANLARNPTVESPLQPASSAVSAVFCVALMAVLGYVRAKYPQADFVTIFASMIAAFALTQNAAAPGFQPTLTLTFLKPVLFSSAVSLAVTILLWPEDSVTDYLNALTDVLDEYNSFFKENTTAFLGNCDLNQHHEPFNTSLPILRTRLQSKFIKLVDSEHEVNYAVIYHQFSHKDLSQMTQNVKSMHIPLHGIGLSNICNHEKPSGNSEKDSESKTVCIENDGTRDRLTMELIDACTLLLKECKENISSNFKQPPRSVWTTFLWPFPRVLYKSPLPSTLPMSQDTLDDIIERFIAATNQKLVDQSEKKPDLSTTGIFDKRQQVFNLFEFNLIGYAERLRTFVSFVDQLNHLQRKKLWLPRVSLKEWFSPSASNKPTFIGEQLASGMSISESGRTGDSSSDRSDIECGLTGFEQQIQETNSGENEGLCAVNRRERPCPRDPDVDAPRNATERFFNYCSIAFNWFYSMPTIFALKTSTGFILLSLPAYFPSSVGWFTGWGGQWVANVFIMWIFPMSGMFNFTLILGLAGSIVGSIVSIVVWEIVRGNAYGLGILSFVVMIASNFIFFTNQNLSYLAIMIQYTYIMIITTGYQDAVGGALQYDSIEMAAGKRMIFVALGILGASLINWFPRPVTGRVELRKMVSRTIGDINMLYGVVFADVLTTDDTPLDHVKAFKKLSLNIQRQLKVEETYLNLSKLEPPLKGKFPYDTYRELIERLNNMTDLAEGMAYCARAMDKSWSRSLIQVFNEERFDYVFCVLNVMCTLSATLKARMPLPPYMISQEDLKYKIDEKLCLALKKHPEQFHSKSFSSFSAFSVACSRFTDELNVASRCVERLLGVDMPEKWLRIHSE